VPSRDGKVAKRAKKEKTKPELPPEIWALILEFLLYSEVMECTAVSPFFLHDILSKVQTLFMNKKGQLDMKQARRFKNGSVKNIFIVSYVKRVSLEDPDELCVETAMRSAPFLQQFPDLKYVMFGGIEPPHLQDADNGRRLHTPTGVCHQYFIRFSPDVDVETEEHRRTHKGLLWALTLALSFGSLPRDLHIHKLSSFFQRMSEADSSLCKAACRSLPMHQLFEKCIWYFNERTCISLETFLAILSGRQGGLAFLREPARLLKVLSYYRCRLDLISLLMRAGCDPRGLAREDLIKHLLKLGYQPSITRQDFRKLQELGFPLLDEHVEYFDVDG
jgi:hypothetical protein